jgi:hypothetical protein
VPLALSSLNSSNEKSLKRRLRAALRSHSFPGLFNDPLLESLEAVGPVAVFGGMVRDMVLNPPSAFDSDVDLVVDADVLSIAECLKTFGPAINRFGGYRITLGTRTIDVWALDRTWAFQAGYVEGGRFQDLVQTTFFNWDAAVYELGEGILHCREGYFESLRSRVLEINLEPNPNPAGNVLRALRLAMSGEAKLGTHLTDYVLRFLEKFGPDSDSFRPYSAFIEPAALKAISRYLYEHVTLQAGYPFDIRATQLGLSFPECREL